MKDLLRIADLSPEDLEHLLRLAVDVRRSPHNQLRLLVGDIVVLYFAKASNRTRLALAIADHPPRWRPQVVGPDELKLGRGENVEDTACVTSRHAGALAIRTYADDDVARFASAAGVSAINALTDGHHPCEALADLLTLRQRFGYLSGLRVAYLGDGNNVAHSLLEACARGGGHQAGVPARTPARPNGGGDGPAPGVGLGVGPCARRRSRGRGTRGPRRLHRRLAVDGRRPA